ncbi:MAG: right-handed parallel beta-helix repeat-containing protein [Candidatus Bipolaricaulia bacterium]
MVKALVWVLMGLLVGNAELAAQRTITVCPSGCDFTSIQEAVNAAIPWETISIGVGEYKESVLIFNKSLKLIGADQAHVKIIGGITVAGAGNEVTLENFTVTGGTGILALGAPLLSLRRMAVIAHLGDGISLFDAARAAIVNTTVANNGMSGIVAKGVAHAQLFDTTLSENKLDGLAAYDQTTIRISFVKAVGNGANGLLIAGQAKAKLDLVHSSANGVRRPALFPAGFRRFCGIHIADNAEAEITVAKLDKNKEAGLCIGGHSSINIDPKIFTKATLANSEIVTENEEHGIIVGDPIKTQDETWALIVNNRIINNKRCGIFKDFEKVELILEGNSISGNPEGEVCEAK